MVHLPLGSARPGSKSLGCMTWSRWRLCEPQFPLCEVVPVSEEDVGGHPHGTSRVVSAQGLRPGPLALRGAAPARPGPAGFSFPWGDGAMPSPSRLSLAPSWPPAPPPHTAACHVLRARPPPYTVASSPPFPSLTSPVLMSLPPARCPFWALVSKRVCVVSFPHKWQHRLHQEAASIFCKTPESKHF